jgi:hypothetical protein
MQQFEQVFTKRFNQISGLMVLGLLITSCSENKVAQCNQLIEIANQAVSGVRAVSETPKPDSIESMNKIADIANTARSQMEKLQLGDDQLKGFQGQFVTMYTETNQATRDLVTAAEAKDADAAKKAFSALQTATAKEAPLVNSVNTYCEATPTVENTSPSPAQPQ